MTDASQSAEGLDAGTALLAADASAIAVDEQDASLSNGAIPSGAAALACETFEDVLACDDFDGQAAGATVSFGTGRGEVTRRDGFLEATVGEQGGRAVMSSTVILGAGSELDLRFSMYVSADEELSGLSFVSLVDADLLNPFEIVLAFEGDEIVARGPAGLRLARASYALPRDRWTCVRLRLLDTGSLGASANLTLDGVPVLTIPSSGLVFPWSVVTASAGIARELQAGAQATLYLDSFLFSRGPLGACP